MSGRQDVCPLVRELSNRARVAGRRSYAGAGNPKARLTAGQVAEIRELAELGHSKAELGRRFGVSRPQVSRIVHGVNW